MAIYELRNFPVMLTIKGSQNVRGGGQKQTSADIIYLPPFALIPFKNIGRHEGGHLHYNFIVCLCGRTISNS